jgi:hypothetical protein
LWKTSTRGASWVELSSVPLAEIWSVSVNPLGTLEVYVAGPGHFESAALGPVTCGHVRSSGAVRWAQSSRGFRRPGPGGSVAPQCRHRCGASW